MVSLLLFYSRFKMETSSEYSSSAEYLCERINWQFEKWENLKMYVNSYPYYRSLTPLGPAPACLRQGAAGEAGASKTSYQVYIKFSNQMEPGN